MNRTSNNIACYTLSYSLHKSKRRKKSRELFTSSIAKKLKVYYNALERCINYMWNCNNEYQFFSQCTETLMFLYLRSGVLNIGPGSCSCQVAGLLATHEKLGGVMCHRTEGLWALADSSWWLEGKWRQTEPQPSSSNFTCCHCHGSTSSAVGSHHMPHAKAWDELAAAQDMWQ